MVEQEGEEKGEIKEGERVGDEEQKGEGEDEQEEEEEEKGKKEGEERKYNKEMGRKRRLKADAYNCTSKQLKKKCEC